MAQKFIFYCYNKEHQRLSYDPNHKWMIIRLWDDPQCFRADWDARKDDISIKRVNLELNFTHEIERIPFKGSKKEIAQLMQQKLVDFHAKYLQLQHFI